jgi:hypothetical protein
MSKNSEYDALLEQVAIEDATPNNQLSTDALRRKKNRLAVAKLRARKKSERRAATEGAAAKAAEDALTNAEWQQNNRKKLDPTVAEQMHARQEAVLDQMYWAQARMKGTYNVSSTDHEYYVGLEEGTFGLDNDVRQFGVVYGYHLPDGIARFRDSIEFRTNIRKYGHSIINEENASEIWFRYGFLCGLPSQFMADFHLATRPKQTTVEWVTLFCATCPPGRQLESSRAVQKSIADRYQELGKKFQCVRCHSMEQKPVAQALKVEYRQPTSNPQDVFLRVGRQQG